MVGMLVTKKKSNICLRPSVARPVHLTKTLQMSSMMALFRKLVPSSEFRRLLRSCWVLYLTMFKG